MTYDNFTHHPIILGFHVNSRFIRFLRRISNLPPKKNKTKQKTEQERQNSQFQAKHPQPQNFLLPASSTMQSRLLSW